MSVQKAASGHGPPHAFTSSTSRPSQRIPDCLCDIGALIVRKPSGNRSEGRMEEVGIGNVLKEGVAGDRKTSKEAGFDGVHSSERNMKQSSMSGASERDLQSKEGKQWRTVEPVMKNIVEK